MKFTDYFEELWFNKKETDIYISLYKLGTQPASIIAKNTGIERTYTYKALIKLSEHWLISTTEKSGIKNFFVDDMIKIKRLVEQKRKKYESMEEDFFDIQTELAQFDQRLQWSAPKIALYDSIEGMKNIYEDIIQEIEKKWYISIKFFASNLAYSAWWDKGKLKNYSDDFFNILKNKKIFLDTFLWNWVMLMESIWKAINYEQIENLPASNSAINIYIVWEVMYIMIFKEIPFGIKIESSELSNTLHFLFENVKTTN